MKGLEVTREVYQAILNDPRWAPFVVYSDHGTAIDLRKYSANKSYLPINSEFQSYCVGFDFMNDLYACVYRTQDDLVYFYPPKDPVYEVYQEKIEVPLIKDMNINNYEDPSKPPQIGRVKMVVDRVRKIE